MIHDTPPATGMAPAARRAADLVRRRRASPSAAAGWLSRPRLPSVSGHLFLSGVPIPSAISPTCEVRFGRMEYAGGERFHLAFMRHTGEWIELYRDLAMAEAFTALQDDSFLQS